MTCSPVILKSKQQRILTTDLILRYFTLLVGHSIMSCSDVFKWKTAKLHFKGSKVSEIYTIDVYNNCAKLFQEAPCICSLKYGLSVIPNQYTVPPNFVMLPSYRFPHHFNTTDLRIEHLKLITKNNVHRILNSS